MGPSVPCGVCADSPLKTNLLLNRFQQVPSCPLEASARFTGNAPRVKRCNVKWIQCLPGLASTVSVGFFYSSSVEGCARQTSKLKTAFIFSLA
jgi:hypothetical protein